MFLSKSFPCLANSYPSKPSSHVPSLESLSWHPSSGPPGTPAYISDTEGVPVDTLSSHKRMEQEFFSEPYPFLSTKCSAWAFVLVSCGALRGPKAPDSSFPGVAELYHFMSADSPHLPGILPTPHPCLVPIKGKEFMPTRPAVGQSLGLEFHTL